MPKAALAPEAAAEKLSAAGTVSKASTGPTPEKGGKPSAMNTAVQALLLQQAIDAAKDVHALDVPRRGGVAGAEEFLNPGVADRIHGRNLPEARMKDVAAAAPRTATPSPESHRERKKASLDGLPGHADGGITTGPGGPRSDGIQIRVSPGEAVISAAVVANNHDLVRSLIARDAEAGRRTGASAEVEVVPDARGGRDRRERAGGARVLRAHPAAGAPVVMRARAMLGIA